MKPFDLEAALRGSPVVTMSGKKVTQIVQFIGTNEYSECIGGVIDGIPYLFYEGGRFLLSGESYNDLFMAEPPKPDPVVRYQYIYTPYVGSPGKTDKPCIAENASGRSIANLAWLKPVPGKQYKFSVFATNGGAAYLRFWGESKERFNTGKLKDGQSAIITWPDIPGIPILGTISGVGEETIVQVKLVEIIATPELKI